MVELVLSLVVWTESMGRRVQGSRTASQSRSVSFLTVVTRPASSQEISSVPCVTDQNERAMCDVLIQLCLV
jgi:hypothetical protein